ncbi:MAG: hypothetical protein NTY31_02665 [Candidatus Falkowbacteria bacterium]|nr:hypothetical protein [Candidatus Falkowbacteria bacterium]
MKKYCLGNQPEEYELREDYLGWLPENDEDWGDLCLEFIKNTELIIVNPQKTKKTLFFHNFIIKDAFPMSFYGEERSKKWNNFAIVSETETSEKFIIPLY